MIRIANLKDKSATNKLRAQVHMLHANARPDMFRNEFCAELADRFDYYIETSEYSVAVCERENTIVGFVVMKVVSLQESPYSNCRNYMLVEELGVDEHYRRNGVGAQLIDFVKNYARSIGLKRVQLDAWAFNYAAIDFYESQGFSVYRKYMELKL